ncbi:YaaL family protein [Listeria aquatica]|uniref:YaaL family protein n=1 Tax=Listeria aquatica TaxID=1494960 RepID=A0A841ZSL6_9LIST|nr:YaaL family protein [Listeria aquatica]MBC1522258.1 YaaL family protein [Listeria aquatica]
MESRSRTHSNNKRHEKRKRKTRIGKLHKSYDEYLLELIEVTQEKWQKERELLDRSFGYDPRLEFEVKKAEMKYFYLFKEARYRQISGRK